MKQEAGVMSGIVTVAEGVREQIIIKKSRFIASVAPINSPHEAVEFVRKVSGEFADATHNVYAWVTQREQVEQKFSDDGEPSGTAGRPVLEVIKKSGLTNVAVVVTRYFGGIMLGAGGLVRAYSESARVGLEAAGRRQSMPYREVWLECPYDTYDQVRYLAKGLDAHMGVIDYAAQVNIQAFIPLEMELSFAQMFQERPQIKLCWGQVVLRVPEEGKLS